MDKKNIEAIFPLTSMQQTLLLHAIQNPKQDLGLLHIQFDIHGTLNITELKQAWQALLNRHQALRSAIYWENLEQPLQIVQRKIQPVWQYLDWSQHSKASQKLKIKNFKSTAKEKGLSLNKAPLTHVSIIKQAADHYHFICHCHHILLDGWSGNLLVTELFVLYANQLANLTRHEQFPTKPLTQPSTKLSIKPSIKLSKAFKYQDYVNWVQQRDIQLAKIFWENQLKESSGKTSWPSRISRKKADYDQRTLTINESITQQIQQLCNANKITLYTFFQGIWSLLLFAYASSTLPSTLSATLPRKRKQKEVLFGVTVSGRIAQLKNIENAIGMFSNVLPLHTKINQQQSLVPWLQSLAVQQSEMSHFDYVTLAQIQTWSPMNFNTLFVFENHAQENLFSNDALTVTGYESGLTSNYPLTVAIQPGDEATVTIVFDRCYLQEKQVAGLLDNWKRLTTAFIAAPHQELANFVQIINVDTTNRASASSNETMQRPNAETGQNKTKPITPVEIALATIWMDILNQQESLNTDYAKKTEKEVINVAREDNFFELGGRSIMAAFLINKIQKNFQVHLPMYRLFEYPTLEKLSTCIQSQEGFKLPSTVADSTINDSNSCLPFTPYTQQKAWNLETHSVGNQDSKESERPYLSLVPIQPKGSKPPLFCVPPAGNTALTYVNLANHLDKDQPLYGLNPLGLEDGSKPQQSVKEMARHYLKEIQQFQPKGPYRFAGTCFGGQVAFEMAQQAKAQGETVQLLALFDPVAPRIIRYKYFIHLLKQEKSPIALVKYIASHLGRRLKAKLSNHLSKGLSLNETQLSQDKKRLEKLMEAHSSAMRHYVPKAYPGELTVFRSEENYALEKKKIGHLAVPWSEYTTGKYNNHVISGVHADMMTGKNLSLMTAKLKSCLRND